jgi:hypothetical protein
MQLNYFFFPGIGITSTDTLAAMTNVSENVRREAFKAA